MTNSYCRPINWRVKYVFFCFSSLALVALITAYLILMTMDWYNSNYQHRIGKSNRKREVPLPLFDLSTLVTYLPPPPPPPPKKKKKKSTKPVTVEFVTYLFKSIALTIIMRLISLSIHTFAKIDFSFFFRGGGGGGVKGVRANHAPWLGVKTKYNDDICWRAPFSPFSLPSPSPSCLSPGRKSWQLTNGFKKFLLSA